MNAVLKRNTKRFAALLIALMIVLTALPFSASAESVTAVTTAAVRLRSGAGTNTSSLRVLSSGTQVTVTDMSNAEWYAVSLSDGTEGYVYSEYLAISAEIPATTNEYVNLRSGAGTNYKSKQVVAQGTSLTVTSTQNSKWYAVRLRNGVEGYIYSIYLDLENVGDFEPSTPSQPTQTPEPSAGIDTAITTAAVNLRSGPGTSYKSAGVVAAGVTVTVTKYASPEWYEVTLSDGRSGYICSRYLLEQSSGESDVSESAVTTTYVNLRSGAGTSYYSMGTVRAGASITVTDRSNREWYAVTLSDGRKGYMYSIYIKIIDKVQIYPTPTPVPTATPEPTPEPTPTPDTGSVIMRTTTAVNLRSGPGVSYSRIQVVSSGTDVTVLAIAQDGWYRVKLTDGTEGYFISDYLTLVSGDLSSLSGESSGETGGSDNNVPETPSDIEYVRTNVSGLNLRSGPGTGYSRVKLLDIGTVMQVLAKADNGWLKVKLTDGTEGYVSSEYVSAYDPSDAGAELPEGTEIIEQYKTLYIEANTSGTVYWSSSDTSVVTVESGSGSQVFVYAVAPGTANIVGKNASGAVLTTKTINVTEPEAIRFAYTTPNIISVGESFDFAAVTDQAKTKVWFEIVGGGYYETSNYTEETNGNNTVRVFTAEAVINTPGTYTVRAYSYANGIYSTTYREFTILVVSTTDRTTTSSESRRISDEMLNAVALFEGYFPEVYPDTLAGNIPTVGYGYVVSKNTTFYNSLTKTEAMAMLADTLNRRGYTTQLNTFITQNSIKMNQHQFDALVSFSYNVGSGYWNSSTPCYLRTIMKENTYAVPDNLSVSNPLYGKVSATKLSVYNGHSSNATVLKSLSSGASVTVTDYYRNSDTAEAWYRISASDVTGWVRSGDITLTSTTGLVRDLAYIDAYTFCNNMLDWHKAGGQCVKGLLNRRVAEAKVFSHGNYAEATKGNANFYKNTYNYIIPDCNYR